MSLPPNSSSRGHTSLQPDSPAPANEYSPEERDLLLRLAHQAIDTALEERELELPAVSELLSSKRT